MWSNTKLLVALSFLIITLGFSFLFFGLNPQVSRVHTTPQPTPHIVENSPISTGSARFAQRGVVGVEGERIMVEKVIDGDTIVVEGGKSVRLIGIDTPETVDPKRPVGCFGKEASDETKGLLSGKVVILQKDVSETDKYGRLLRYVYLPLDNNQILFIDDYLVREGFARVLTYPPDVKYNEQFRQAETEAKLSKRGLWGRC